MKLQLLSCLFALIWFFPFFTAIDGHAEVEYLGPAMKSVATFAGFFTEASGDQVFYGATRSGLYCRLYRYNVTQGKVDLVVPIYEAVGAWGMALAENIVYIGTYSPAALYSYDITTGTLTHITTFPDDEFVWTLKLDNGVIYIGNSPTGRVFTYNIADGKVSCLGPMSTGTRVRSIEIYNGRLYAGMGTLAELIEYDLQSGLTQNILPAEYSSDSMVYHQVIIGSKLILGLYPSNRIVSYDLRTGEFTLLMEDAVNNPGLGSPTFSEDTVHFRGLWGLVFEYRKSTNSLQRLFLGLPPEVMTGSQIVNQSFVAGVSRNAYYIERSFDGTVQKSVFLGDVGLDPTESYVFSFWAHNNKLYLGETVLRIFDVKEQQDTYSVVYGEPKSMCMLDGALLTANYESARLWRFPGAVLQDPNSYRFDDANQFLLLDIAEAQNRPKKIVSDESTKVVLVGTEPTYGQYGGALTYYDTITDNHYTYRNIVLNHTINEIAFDDNNRNIAYLGTSVYGGTGTDPLNEDAHVVKFDLINQSIMFDIIPGLKNSMILSLVSIGNKLYVLTNNKHIISYDSESFQVIKKNRPAFIKKLIYASDGNIYGFDYNKFYLINKDTLEIVKVAGGFNNIRFVTEDKITKKFYLIDYDWNLWKITRPVSLNYLFLLLLE